MKNKYLTKDFYLSAFLLASGMTLIAFEKSAGLTNFEFEETDTLNSLIQNYYGFKAFVNPVAYGNAIRTLKTIIHSNTHGTELYHTQARKAS